MDNTQLFYLQIRELIESYDIERLVHFKRQMEIDLGRIGYQASLIEKYHLVCKAIDQVKSKKALIS